MTSKTEPMVPRAEAMTLKAKDMSLSMIADLDRGPKPGQVHSAYENTVNIICDDMTWLSLHPTEIPMHPYAVRLRIEDLRKNRRRSRAGSRCTLLGAQPGEAIAVSRSQIVLEKTGMAIDIAAADLWNPYLRPPRYGDTGRRGLPDTPSGLPRRADRSATSDLSGSSGPAGPFELPGDGLCNVLEDLLGNLNVASPFLAVVLGRPLVDCSSWPRTVQAEAGRALRDVETGLQSRSPDSILSGVRRAVGLGPGATPSGDDFLTGLIGAYYFFAYDDEFRQRLFVSIAPLISRTTLPAFFMLRAALRGLCSEPLAALLYSLRDCGTARQDVLTDPAAGMDPSITESVDTLRSAVTSLADIGATSGQDMLAGVLSWLLATTDCGCAYAAN